jgi:hypothetical protein
MKWAGGCVARRSRIGLDMDRTAQLSLPSIDLHSHTPIVPARRHVPLRVTPEICLMLRLLMEFRLG